MVEKGEISSCSYKTIVQIPPFPTIWAFFHILFVFPSFFPFISFFPFFPPFWHYFEILFVCFTISALCWHFFHFPPFFTILALFWSPLATSASKVAPRGGQGSKKLSRRGKSERPGQSSVLAGRLGLAVNFTHPSPELSQGGVHSLSKRQVIWLDLL